MKFVGLRNKAMICAKSLALRRSIISLAYIKRQFTFKTESSLKPYGSHSQTISFRGRQRGIFFVHLVNMFKFLFLSFFFIFLFKVDNVEGNPHDYREALAKSLLFFQGQRSGRLPPHQLLTWRSNSGLSDGRLANVRYYILLFFLLFIM